MLLYFFYQLQVPYIYQYNLTKRKILQHSVRHLIIHFKETEHGDIGARGASAPRCVVPEPPPAAESAMRLRRKMAGKTVREKTSLLSNAMSGSVRVSVVFSYSL